MTTIAGFDSFPLHFNEGGKLIDGRELTELTNKVSATPGAEVVLIAHGFRNSEVEANNLYTGFLKNFAAHQAAEFSARLAARKLLVGMIFWPSKPFREEDDGKTQSLDDSLGQKEAAKAQLDSLQDVAETPKQKASLERAKELLETVEHSREAQDEFADCVRAVLEGNEADPLEGETKFREISGSEMMDKLGAAPIIVPTEARDGDEGGAQSLSGFVPAPTGADLDGGTEGLGSFFQNIFGRIGHFLNLTLWYVMKNRAIVVGGAGVADVVRQLKKMQPTAPKVHLVGHSLGGLLMASCARALSLDKPVTQVDSLSLLEAAFSHFGFSGNNGKNQQGAFRSVVVNHVVKGPLFCTYSMKDTVVGHVYAIASRLAGQNVQDIGDANDPFGGIGRNGAQKTEVNVQVDMLRPGSKEYTFTPGKIWSLNGSNGLVMSHGDVTNPAVTFAFACALAQT